VRDIFLQKVSCYDLLCQTSMRLSLDETIAGRTSETPGDEAVRSRGVVGKRIVGIKQKYLGPREVGEGLQGQSVEELLLEDGTKLLLWASESEHEPYVQVIVMKPKKR